MAFCRSVIAVIVFCFPRCLINAQVAQTNPVYLGNYIISQYWYQADDAFICTNPLYWTICLHRELQVTLQGRNYIPVTSEPTVFPTTKWREKDERRNENTESWYALGIRKEDGRVYANLEEYKKYLSRTFNHVNEQPSFGDPEYIPYRTTEDGEVILYDYNMEVGDQYLSAEGHDDVSVVEKDMVRLADGFEHRRLILSNGLILIEDIGCINSFPLDYLNLLPQFADFFCSLLSAIDTGFDELYITDLNIQPNEPVGISTTKSDAQSYVSNIYDLQGRRLDNEPQHGVFIRDGRKVVK